MGKPVWPRNKKLLLTLTLLCTFLPGIARGQPHISVWPDSLSDSLFTGETSAHWLTLHNQGDSALIFELSTVEASIPELEKAGAEIFSGKGVIEETFGWWGGFATGGLRARGNVFFVSASRYLIEVRFYMNVQSSTQMSFVVYRGNNLTGPYEKVEQINIPDSGTGQRWYSSGPMHFRLIAGNYYFIGTYWWGPVTYARGYETVPIFTSFGTLQTGSTQQGFPPPDSIYQQNYGISPYYQTIVTSEEPTWLTFAQTQGTVPPGDSIDVEIGVDATDLYEGGYHANIYISSNDPMDPAHTVPAHLHVTNAPDIALSDTLLYFAGYGGSSGHDITFYISNVGNDPLTVTNIFSDDERFSVDTTSFSLNPDEIEEVAVSFTGSDTGFVEGTLFIESNDPDEPVVTVNLVWEGLIAPDISLSPDSVYQVISPEDRDSSQILIANNGGGELRWETAISYESSTLFDVDILFDSAHGQPSSAIWTDIIEELMSRGATFTENTDSITANLLSNYEVLWLAEANIPLPSPEMLAIQDWVSGGGALLLEGDSDDTVPIYNDLLSALGAGIAYSSQDGGGGFTTRISPHLTTTRVDTIILISNLAQIAAVSPPASMLIEDAPGNGNTAYSLAGEGRIMAMADELFSNDHIIRVDNRRFANQVFSWLTKRVHWLSLAPEDGSVLADSSTDISVIFDPALGGSGHFKASILFSSNDPDEPEVTVPIHVHVLGDGEISVSDSAFSFGIIFIGAEASDTLTVINTGNDVLTVSDIYCHPGDFSVDTTTFSLSPRESQDILATFTPGTPGDLAGTLTIQSDDPDTPLQEVYLTGYGLPPPDISIMPDSLVDSLFAGTYSMKQLEIFNQGSSDLTFRIYARERIEAPKSSAGPAATRKSADDAQTSSSDQLFFGFPVFSRKKIGSEAARSPGSMPKTMAEEPIDSLHILLLTSSGNPTEIQTALLNFPDVSVVDIYHAYSVTPSLSELALYHVVIVANAQQFNDPTAMGNVLADYADAGGGVILTLAAFASGQEVLGRLLEENYLPLEIGNQATSPANLGTFNAAHQIMSGVTTAHADLIWNTALSSGAELVAEWGNGYPCVATKGWNVAAVNVFVGSPGFWSGDIPLILHNAARWTSGTIRWMITSPLSGTVPADSSANISIRFDTASLDTGHALAEIIVVSNDLDEPEKLIPVDLFVRGPLPRIVVGQDTLSFGLITLGAPIEKGLSISNNGPGELEIYSFSFDDGLLFSTEADPASLSPGGLLDVAIRFLTQEFQPSYTDILYLHSNDPYDPDHPVHLTAFGDLTPPQAIDDLVPSLINEDIHLLWTEPLDDSWVTHYVIYRGSDLNTIDDSIGATATTVYIDSGVIEETDGKFYYAVKSVDAAGRKSEKSNVVGEFTRRLWGRDGVK